MFFPLQSPKSQLSQLSSFRNEIILQQTAPHKYNIINEMAVNHNKFNSARWNLCTWSVGGLVGMKSRKWKTEKKTSDENCNLNEISYKNS